MFRRLLLHLGIATCVVYALASQTHLYPKSKAVCNAVNRATNEVKEIDIHYVELNPGAERTLLMVHGWPSLWHSWKNQIEAFKEDYRLVVPDLRGFGASTHPDDVESSGTMHDIVGDLVCVLEKAGVQKAVCVGHDWGSQVCYSAARMRPDIFEGVVGVAVPYLPSAGPFVPVADLLPVMPYLAYQVFFQKHTAAAVEELAKDIRRTLRGVLRTVDSQPPKAFLSHTDSFMRGWEGVEEIPPSPMLTAEEEDYWVEQYSIQAFKNTLQFYTHGNRYESWKFVNEQGNHTIPQPALSILPTADRVADWVMAAKLLKSGSFIPQLTTETVYTGHWPQLEKPQEVNQIMKKWLDQWYPPSATSQPEKGSKRPVDEL